MNKMIHFLAWLAFLALTQPAFADENCDSTIDVSVNGLVCDFCARALEKVFGEHEEVDDIHVDLDKSLVTVSFQDKQTMDNDTLKALITDAGYDVKNIDRGC